MNPEPISLVILGGVAGELAKTAIGYLRDNFGDQEPLVQQRAAEQARAMLGDLQIRMTRLEGESRQSWANDPDAATVLKDAILAAARSASSEKHKLLARSVAERFASPPESIHAIASAQAIEIIPRLTSGQLNYLALAAFVLAIRPDGIPLRDEAPPGQLEVTDEENVVLQAYLPWLKSNLQALSPIEVLSPSDVAHLVASSTVMVERGIGRELEATLSPFGSRFVSYRASSLYMDIRELMYEGSARALIEQWKESLQHVTLTPVGLLIGIAVFDLKTGVETNLASLQSVAQSSTNVIETTVWGAGGGLTQKFMQALDKEVQSRAERGVGIWRELFEK